MANETPVTPAQAVTQNPWIFAVIAAVFGAGTGSGGTFFTSKQVHAETDKEIADVRKLCNDQGTQLTLMRWTIDDLRKDMRNALLANDARFLSGATFDVTPPTGLSLDLGDPVLGESEPE